MHFKWFSTIEFYVKMGYFFLFADLPGIFPSHLCAFYKPVKGGNKKYLFFNFCRIISIGKNIVILQWLFY